MATHSSILAWEIPWREGPGRLQSSFSGTYLPYDMGHVIGYLSFFLHLVK